MNTKVLKYENLKQILLKKITVLPITERLERFLTTENVKKAYIRMKEKNYDYAGVVKDDTLIGYLDRSEIKCKEGLCIDFMKEFKIEDVISETTPLIDVLKLMKIKLKKNKNLSFFILQKNQIKYVLHISDLQKSPVRMLIFSLITVFESKLTEYIRSYIPQKSWEIFLKDRLEEPKRIYNDLTSRNQDMDLLDCLLLTDKKIIFLKKSKTDKQIIQFFGFQSKNQAEKILDHLNRLRNTVTHARSLTIDLKWNKIFDLIVFLDKTLNDMEM